MHRFIEATWADVINKGNRLMCASFPGYIPNVTQTEISSSSYVAFIPERRLYLEETSSHGKDPPDHLEDLPGVRQERQPAEGKSHQHSQSDSHEQEKPTGQRSTDRQGSPLRAGGTEAEHTKYCQKKTLRTKLQCDN